MATNPTAATTPVPIEVPPDTNDRPTLATNDAIQVTGVVTDFVGPAGDPGEKVFAVVSFPLHGGGAIGIPTDLKGMKLGDKATLTATVLSATRYVTKVAFTNNGAGGQTAELDRFTAAVVK